MLPSVQYGLVNFPMIKPRLKIILMIPAIITAFLKDTGGYFLGRGT